MKRFILDFFLVILLVVLGSSFSMKGLDEQIDDFEQKNPSLPLETSSNPSNKATLLAKKSGETIENIVGISVEVISSIFKAIVE